MALLSRFSLPPESAKLWGKTFECGAFTRDRLTRLLGLEQAPVDFYILDVFWDRDHLKVELCPWHGDDSVTLIIEAVSDEKIAFLTGKELCLWSKSSQLPPSLASRFQRVTAKMLEKLAFADIVRMLLLDPDLREETIPQNQPSSGSPLEGISLPNAAQHALEASEFYADFFAAPEIRRAGCDIIDVHTAHSYVSHGDVECSYCAVCIPRPRSALIRLPVYESVRNIGRLPVLHGQFDESEDPAEIASSDMTEQDVIRGAPGKIEKLLHYAERHKKKHNLLVVGLCLPDVIGEDQESVVRDFDDQTSTPVYMVPPSPRSWSWLAKDLLRTRRKALPVIESDPLAINLVGFPRNQGSSDLQEILAGLGIRVQSFVLPELSMDSVAAMRSAKTNVYLPNVHWDKAYEHLHDDPDRLHLTLDGPFGLDETSAWLQAICSKLPVKGSVADLLSQRFAVDTDRWETLRGEARNYRLGIIVNWLDIDALIESRYTWGIPLLAALREMGFGLDLFVGGSEARAAVTSFRQRTELSAQDYEIQVFASLEDMLSLLKASSCRAVFSNYVFDWRLLQAGKASFSTLEFEMGLRGAPATLERLLTLCRLPLFHAGRRFLSQGLPNAISHGR